MNNNEIPHSANATFGMTTALKRKTAAAATHRQRVTAGSTVVATFAPATPVIPNEAKRSEGTRTNLT